MKAEGATSASILEIERCLSGCVAANKLIEYAKENKTKLCFAFCGFDERSDGVMVGACGCKDEDEITDQDIEDERDRIYFNGSSYE